MNLSQFRLAVFRGKLPMKGSLKSGTGTKAPKFPIGHPVKVPVKGKAVKMYHASRGKTMLKTTTHPRVQGNP